MASLGFCPQGSVWRAEHSFGMRTLVRIQLWWWRGRGVAGVVPATSSAAAEARVQVGMGLRCANERGEVPRRLYAMRGARWAHARDQMVTGASPATGAAAAKVRPWRGYSVESGRDQGRRGRRCGCSQRVRWRRRRGRGRSGCCESTTTAVGAEDEGNNDDGAAGRSGVVCLSEDEEQVMAELLDRSRGRGGGDSRGGARR